jgi:methyl acetate hydrolase
MGGMIGKFNRRQILKTAAALAAANCGVDRAGLARAREAGGPGEKSLDEKSLGEIHALLRSATAAGEVPGIVALAATEGGVVYEGVFGRRRLPDGPAMTRDTVFRIASMVKLITSVAALQLVEQGRLSLDAPVPAVDPELGEPQVFDGLDAKGAPILRPAKGPISLRQLLTHTSGFSYRLWDAKVVVYYSAIAKLPAAKKSKAPRLPLMFDPGTRWQYGPGINWVGRLVQDVSGEPIDVYLRKHIFDPLGMRDTAFVITPEQRSREASCHRRQAEGSLQALPIEHPPPHQTFSGGGGIYSTAGDYLTLLRALLAGGAFGGVRILRPQTVALMGRNQIGAIEVGVLRTTVPALSNDVDFFPGISCKWGLGHMLNMQAVPGGRSAGSMTWAGLFNTYYWIDPVRRVAAVFLTQVLPFADHRALRLYRQFERGIYAAL